MLAHNQLIIYYIIHHKYNARHAEVFVLFLILYQISITALIFRNRKLLFDEMSKVTDPEISLCEMIVEICAQHLLTRGQWAEKLSSAITYKIESKEMQRSSAFFQKLCVSLSVLSRQHQNTVQFILMWFLFQKILC